MSNEDFLPEKHYENLYAFQKAEAIYDLTFDFLEKNISTKDRTHDQMLQSARSGKQNIVEGRIDGAVSAEMEIKLFGVAIGSLHELLNDYKDFMRTRRIEIWGLDHPRMPKLRAFCATHNDTEEYRELGVRLDNTAFCNMMLTILYQTIAMLSKLRALIGQDFLENGGIKEQMYKARKKRRDDNKN